MCPERVALWASVIVGLPVALALTLRLLIRTAGYRCTNCGERMAVFTEVSGREQHRIIRYFREREHRMPDTGTLRACRRCGLLYDEFSLELCATLSGASWAAMPARRSTSGAP